MGVFLKGQGFRDWTTVLNIKHRTKSSLWKVINNQPPFTQTIINQNSILSLKVKNSHDRKIVTKKLSMIDDV